MPIKGKSTLRKVIEHIANLGEITRPQALFHYKVQNLADVIMRLRNKGWRIKTTKVRIADSNICYYTMSPYHLHCEIYNGTLILNKDTGRYEAPFES